MNIENHRAHRVHRAKPQFSVLSAPSVYQKIDAFLPQAMAMAKLPSGYELTRTLPENLISSLPGIKELDGIHKEGSDDE